MTSTKSTTLRRTWTAFVQRNPSLGAPGPLLFYVALSTIPLMVLIVFLWRYTLPIPLFDQWHLVPLMMMAEDDSLTLGAIWAQHNEHRIPVPKLMLIGLAMMTNWNLAYEVALNVLCGMAIYVLYALLTFRAARHLALSNMTRILPLLALAIFSLNQFENWSTGFQVQILVCVLAATACAALLGAERGGPIGFALAILLATTASYSFGSGILYWFAAIPILLARPGAWRKILLLRLLPWATAGVGVTWIYFLGYQSVSTVEAAPGHFSNHFPEMIEYTLVYLGKFVYVSDATGAAICGAAGIAIQTVGFVVVLFNWRKLALALAPIYSLSLFAIGNALLTAPGRARYFSLDMLLASGRYNSFSMLLWLSVVVSLALFLAAAAASAPSKSTFTGVRGRLTGWLLLAGVILAIAITSYASIAPIKDRNARLRASSEALMAGETGRRIFFVICYDAALQPEHRKEITEEYIPFLRERGMAGF